MGTLIVKTVKIPKRVAAALSRTARARGCSESELIREGIEKVIGGDDGLDMQAVIGPDLGAGRGPRDLSHGSRHRASYGRSRHR
jgi:hypothetical protein